MQILFFLFIGGLGLAVGSFLNVCIYRLPEQKSIILPASHCPTCQTKLQVRDLIPLFSYVALKNKCRYCGAEISRQYPLIELINGLGWVLLVAYGGLTVQTVAAILLFSFALVITVIDLRHYLILNNVLIALFFFGIVYHFVLGTISGQVRLIGMVIGFLIPFTLALISRGGMGGGDIKLCAVMGFWLGFPGIFQAIFIGALVGGVVGVALLLTKTKKRKDPIPFGPFLMLGFLIVFLFQEQIHFWYWSLF